MITIEAIELIKVFILNNYIWLIVATILLGVALRFVNFAAKVGVIILSIYVLSKFIF